MKRLLQIAIPAMILAFGATVMTTSVYGSAKIAKETGAKCLACHTKAASKDLNDAGKCYKEKKDLKTCSITAPAK